MLNRKKRKKKRFEILRIINTVEHDIQYTIQPCNIHNIVILGHMCIRYTHWIIFLSGMWWRRQCCVLLDFVPLLSNVFTEYTILTFNTAGNTRGSHDDVIKMETFSALLALFAGNSPAPGEFPAQRPVMRSFDVFFELRLNKPLNKQSWGWWLRRDRAHYNVIVLILLTTV